MLSKILEENLSKHVGSSQISSVLLHSTAIPTQSKTRVFHMNDSLQIISDESYQFNNASSILSKRLLSSSIKFKGGLGTTELGKSLLSTYG